MTDVTNKTFQDSSMLSRTFSPGKTEPSLASNKSMELDKSTSLQDLDNQDILLTTKVLETKYNFNIRTLKSYIEVSRRIVHEMIS